MYKLLVSKQVVVYVYRGIHLWSSIPKIISHILYFYNNFIIENILFQNSYKGESQESQNVIHYKYIPNRR